MPTAVVGESQISNRVSNFLASRSVDKCYNNRIQPLLEAPPRVISRWLADSRLHAQLGPPFGWPFLLSERPRLDARL